MKNLIVIGFVLATCGCGANNRLRAENAALRQQNFNLSYTYMQLDARNANLVSQVAVLSMRDQACTTENATLHGQLMRIWNQLQEAAKQQQPPPPPPEKNLPNPFDTPRGTDI